jgi:hypothetical protein
MLGTLAFPKDGLAGEVGTVEDWTLRTFEL